MNRSLPLALSLGLGCAGALPAAPAPPEVLAEWNADRESVHEAGLPGSPGPTGTLATRAAFDADGHLLFDGGQTVTLPELLARQLVDEGFTIEARVRVDRPHPWGCIIGYSQDNGSHERGWTLGYNNRRFCFKVSDGGPLTGAVSERDFTPGEWTNLVATFDSGTARLFVNGRLAGSGEVRNPIALPSEGTPFVLGAYQDDDEHFPMHGRIAFVRLSRGILSDEKIAATRMDDDGVRFAVQPRVSFPDPSTAVISWQAAPGEATLFHGRGKLLDQQASCASANGRYAVTLSNLSPTTEYRYRIGTSADGKRRFSKIHTFDTRHNLSPAGVEPLPGTDPATLAAARDLLSLVPEQAGYILVLGIEDGELAAALASQSRFHVVVADHDPARVATTRQRLYQAGLLGHRTSVVQLEAGSSSLPWTDRFADLVVSERGVPPLSAHECLRLLRPKGGVLAVAGEPSQPDWRDAVGDWPHEGDFAIHRRPDLEGARDWTHLYGTAGNAAYTGEALGEVSATSGMEVQWIGRPGGDFGIDRQPRMPAPLASNGRLFHQGMDRLVALNAYNGAVLWSYEIPALRRLNVVHDCSNWSADDRHVFLAIRDRLWVLDARDGGLVHALQLPVDERETHEWGYVANEGKLLIGSAVRADSSFQDYWGDSAWFDKVGAAGSTSQVCSDRLFGYRKDNGEGLWAYGRGLIINSTLSLHDGRLYFLENRTLALADTASGRISDRRLWLDLTAVCLDATSGQLIWERPAPAPRHLTEQKGFVQAAYGIATDHGFFAVLSEGHVDEDGTYLKNGHFLCTRYHPDGSVAWETSSPWMADHHGVHITHPVVTEDRLYLAPHIHDIATGEPLEMVYGPRRGCSTIVATKNALMFRILGEGNSPLGLWDKDTGSVSRFMQLRPSCWLNTLPAQGMLLVPEGGAGCSCGGWIETSLGFLPRSPLPAPSTPPTP